MNRGLFHTKNKRFKIKALKKPGHRPPTNHDYTGGEEFFAHGINLSQDGRRVENIFETIQVEDEDDDRYAAMILGEEGLFESPDSVQFNCEDTSTERKQVNRPFVVYEAPLKAWIPRREEYLSDIIGLEGPGPHSLSSCRGCRRDDLTQPFRCSDCFGGYLYCAGCIVAQHATNPLHRIVYWNGSFFDQTDLFQLGFSIQLGHPAGDSCLHPTPCDPNFRVVHTNGIHRIRLNFCSCIREVPIGHERQLLQCGWWPASIRRPKTCMTIAVLNHFHKQTLQGKIAAFDFYRALELETDNTSLGYLPDRLASFMLVVRQFRHIKMLQRGGRGHAEGGILATALGEIAVLCAACPHPGINLPEGWEDFPDDIQDLFRLMLSTDANFRLDSRMVSSTDKDPGLGTGLSYFVEDNAYNEWVLQHADQEELSTCAGFAALLKANLTRTKGLRSTGVGAVVCVHDQWRPNGIGDLQKGERYCNMDFLWLSTLRHNRNKKVLTTYDIMCQWVKNLLSRIENAPPELRFNFNIKDLEFAIPKFHLLAHGQPCNIPYSLNYKKGVGRVDGEGVERCWSNLNGVAPSTRQMGPGSRKDTIEDHAGHHNWRKTVNLGYNQRCRMENALPAAVEHQVAFELLDEGLREVRNTDVNAWEKMLAAYSEDPKKPNPYESPVPKISLAKVRLRYATEEAKAAEGGSIAAHETSSSAFILAGFELEDLQRTMVFEKRNSATTNQATLSQDRRLGFFRKLSAFRALREAYMPGLVANEAVSSDSNTEVPLHQIPLHLPSSVPLTDRVRTCPESLYTIEADLRYGQAYDALEDLRRHLRTRTSTNRFKIKNVTGQRANTRARSLQNTIDKRVKISAARYRHARETHLHLVGSGSWESVLQELAPADVRALNERGLTEHEKEERRRLRLRVGLPNEDDEFAVDETTSGGPGEGYRTLSWIWLRPTGASDFEADMHDTLRVEWCKARARAERWREEVRNIREEMRRIPVFFNYRADRWRQRGSGSHSLSTPAGPGHLAYAFRQAAMFEKLAKRFSWMWQDCCTQANAYLLTHNIPVELELSMLANAGDPELGSAQGSSMVSEPAQGQDEDDEDQWGVSASV